VDMEPFTGMPMLLLGMLVPYLGTISLISQVSPPSLKRLGIRVGRRPTPVCYGSTQIASTDVRMANDAVGTTPPSLAGIAVRIRSPGAPALYGEMSRSMDEITPGAIFVD
jgi:hypothetical protein